MSQAGIIRSSGGGGGGTENFITDNGTATQVGGDLNVLGQDAGTVPVMFTTGSGNTVTIENRTWETQYVVDPSATVGLRGTFQNIQSAMDQAVSDGMTVNNPKKIYIRTGTYTENLDIPPGTLLVGETFGHPYGGAVNAAATTINGVHTFSGSVVCGFNNLQFLNVGGSDDMFSGGVIALAYFDNCGIASTSTGSIINATSSGGHYSFSNCMFTGNGGQVYFETAVSNELVMVNCTFEQPMSVEWVGEVQLTDTDYVGSVILDTGNLIANRCLFTTASGDPLVDGTGECNLYHCSFFGADQAIADTITINKMIFCGVDDGDRRLFGPSNNFDWGACQQGNIIRRITTATNYDVESNDYYVGVTSTASARTINLPAIGEPNKGQVFIIKDESGGAGTNNITVTTVAGVATIDGATTQPININYGSMTVMYDGTNYFII